MLALTHAAARDGAALDTLVHGSDGSVAPDSEIAAAEDELRQARDRLSALVSARARLAEEWSELGEISQSYTYRTRAFEMQAQRSVRDPRTRIREMGVRAVDHEATQSTHGAQGALSRYAHAHRSVFISRDSHSAGDVALAADHIRRSVGTSSFLKRDARGDALCAVPRVHVSRHGSISIGAAPAAVSPPRRDII